MRSIITKAMQKLPSHRFNSATEMLKSVQLAAQVERKTTSFNQTESIFDLSFSSG